MQNLTIAIDHLQEQFWFHLIAAIGKHGKTGGHLQRGDAGGSQGCGQIGMHIGGDARCLGISDHIGDAHIVRQLDGGDVAR